MISFQKNMYRQEQKEIIKLKTWSVTWVGPKQKIDKSKKEYYSSK